MSEDAAQQLPEPTADAAASTAAAAEPPQKKYASGTYKCLCGGCSYSVEGAPALSAICHCETCRTHGGGPALAAAYAPAQFRYGEGTEEHLNKYESAPSKFRHNCKKCGSAVHNTLPNGVQVVFLGNIRWDTSAGGEIVRPTSHIWVSAKGDEEITDSLPQFEGWPQ